MLNVNNSSEFQALLNSACEDFRARSRTAMFCIYAGGFDKPNVNAVTLEDRDAVPGFIACLMRHFFFTRRSVMDDMDDGFSLQRICDTAKFDAVNNTLYFPRSVRA